MVHDRGRRLALGLRTVLPLQSCRQQIPFTVLATLLLGVLAVVRRGTADVALATVARSTSKAATQIGATGVTRMGKKQNPAMPAALQTGPQIGPLAQQRPNLGIVRAHQIAHARALMVPIRMELKMRRDFVCYKPRR
jgi:hypothetical protein